MAPPHPRSLIGTPPNHWLHTPATSEPPTEAIFDLTRPAPPFPLPSPTSTIRLPTTTTPIQLDPSRTALVVVDMQNFFLSPALGRPPDSAGNTAALAVADVAVPAARKAGIRVIWLNWGLTDADVAKMPPATMRAFGFSKPGYNPGGKEAPAVDAHGVNESAATAVAEAQIVESNPGASTASKVSLTENGKPTRIYSGLGSEMGEVELEDGKAVDAGRLLFRDTWNAALIPRLQAAFVESQREEGVADDKSMSPTDIVIHKNRMSGLWGSSTPCTEFLDEKGITTLLFAGVNTDQCVGGSLQDAFSRGWDCVLLRDCCGTTSGAGCQAAWEFNSEKTYGFLTNAGSLRSGVDEMFGARQRKLDSK